jgi:hypothetical protein
MPKRTRESSRRLSLQARGRWRKLPGQTLPREVALLPSISANKRPSHRWQQRRIHWCKRRITLTRFATECHESFRRGDKIARSQGRIIFHTQWSQAKRISTVTSAVCHLFLAVEERGVEFGVALTVFGVGTSNLTPEKELGLAVRADRPACVFRCPIDELPNTEVLPIAQAYTEANGSADAAIATHSFLTLSGWGHSTDCRRRCVRRWSRPLKATKQKIKRTFGTRPVRHYRAC